MAALTRCPGVDGIKFCSQWYKHADVDDFWICSRCFEDKIKSTLLGRHFHSFMFDPLPGQTGSCDCNNDHFSRLLDRHRGSGNIDRLLAYMYRRSAVLGCQGTKGVLGGQNVKWYSSPDLPSFVTCEACYIDYISPSPFASHFQENMVPQPPGDRWSCDIAEPYIKRLVSLSSSPEDWQRFVPGVQHRMSLPRCSSNAVQKSSRKWFRPVNATSSACAMICEPCYLDLAAATNIASQFAEVCLSVTEQNESWICDNSIPAVRDCTFVLGAQDTIPESQFRRWNDYLGSICSQPLCVGEGLENGEWYTLRDPCNSASKLNSDLDLCKACYTAYGNASGFANAFMRIDYPPGSTRLCDFNGLSCRAIGWHDAWSQSFLTANLKPLIDFATLIANVPPCARAGFVPNKSWWGMDDFFFCESCYKEIGQHSYFAPHFTWQARTAPTAKCDMYTDNMRQRYVQACRAKDPGEFTKYCKERNEYYDAHMKNVNFQMQMRNFNQRAGGINLAANLAMQTGAVMRSGVGSMDWTYATNNVMQAHTNLIIGAGRNCGNPAANRIAAGWFARE